MNILCPEKSFVSGNSEFAAAAAAAASDRIIRDRSGFRAQLFHKECRVLTT